MGLPCVSNFGMKHPLLFTIAALLCCASFCQAQKTAAPSPEQRRQEALQRLEKTLRDTMNWCELTDKTLQDAVVQCALAEENVLEPVRETHRKVAQALVDKQAGNTQFATLLNDWRGSVEDAKDSRTKAIAKLKTQVDFIKQPKVESFLTITGLIGDEASFIIGAEGHLLNTLGNLAAQPQK